MIADEIELDDCREGDSDLPEGWACSPLSDAVQSIQSGFACGVTNREGQGIPHLRPMNVNAEGRLTLSDLKYVPMSEADREARLVAQGDVLFNNTNTPELVGKTAYYGLPEARAFSNHMTRVRCCQEVLDPQFCAMAVHYRWQEGFYQAICNNHVSQASISTSVLSGVRISIPPLAEQKRIVAKVEELLAQVNAARDRLAKVPALLKRFRQSVLAAACSGRLTADWRANHPDVEPASELLKRILAERLQEYEATCEEAKAQRRKPPKRPDNLQLREPDTSECPELPELPEDWMLITVKESAVLMQYGTSEKADAEDGIAMLRMSNIQEGRIELGSLKYIEWNPDDAAPFLVEPGDLLFNRTNSPELVGKTAVFDADLDAVFASYLVRVRLDGHMADSRFVCNWINSWWGKEWAMMVKTDGVSQSNINATKLADMPLPLPPLPEQEEIVRRVEALFALADGIEKSLRAATIRTEKLTQAILAKAFRGELVPTEADLARKEGRTFEPASVLLARIRHERASSPQNGRSKPKRR